MEPRVVSRCLSHQVPGRTPLRPAGARPECVPIQGTGRTPQLATRVVRPAAIGTHRDTPGRTRYETRGLNQ